MIFLPVETVATLLRVAAQTLAKVLLYASDPFTLPCSALKFARHLQRDLPDIYTRQGLNGSRVAARTNSATMEIATGSP
jgi:molybdopterin-guanine dinucleotide biosynthesis protein A